MIRAEAPQIPETAATLSSRPMPRLHFIDGLRGLAMLMVLLYHCWLFGGQWHVSLPFGAHSVNLASVLGFGHVGVNLFLVLSGFCLYWPFVKGGARREPTLWEFAKKRCRRILPPYYVALIIFGIPLFVQALRHHSSVDLGFAVTWFCLHVLMIHNLRPDYVMSVNGSLWSLALEFQLYILFPVIVEAFRRFPARVVLLTVMVLSAAYRFFLVRENYLIDDGYAYVLAYSLLGRCFEFVLGMFTAMLVARWHEEGKSPLRPSDYLLPLIITPLAILDGKHGHFQALTDIMWGLVFAALLLMASRPHTAAHRLLSSRALVSLGIFSYSVYLIHLPLVIYLGQYAYDHFSNTVLVLFQLFLVVPSMLGLGYVFHLLFEKPFMTPSKPRKTLSPINAVSVVPILEIAEK
jgi:peptidoglycan/LPS O-acetylase OafA/YrhL